MLLWLVFGFGKLDSEFYQAFCLESVKFGWSHFHLGPATNLCNRSAGFSLNKLVHNLAFPKREILSLLPVGYEFLRSELTISPRINFVQNNLYFVAFNSGKECRRNFPIGTKMAYGCWRDGAYVRLHDTCPIGSKGLNKVTAAV